MMRQAARRGLVIDPAQPTPALSLQELPAQHESFNDQWRKLSDDLKLIAQGVRAIGPTIVGPEGESLTVAGEVRLHPSLATRFGKRCVTILDESKNLSQEGPYAAGNVKADTLPAFA